MDHAGSRRPRLRWHSVQLRVAGPVDTRILDDFRADLGTDRVQADIDRVGRPGTAADVAPVFAFLMSPDSGWANGVDLACDGGLAAILALT